MSGVFGVYGLDGRPATDSQLRSMSHAQAHRGPDGQRRWHEGSVGLGHCMLFSTPEAPAEVQPFVHVARGLTITADARLDEREELASSLGLRERLRQGLPDAELILAAYARWGTACAKRLRGDFAFALWDRPRRRLFCARDLFGVKPFNYHSTPTFFCFASEMRGVLAHPAVPRELNEGRIADFLVDSLEGIDHISTFYRGVQRLPPAHHAVVSSHGLCIERYAEIEAPRELRLRSNGEYVEAFRERLDMAVRSALRCHGEPASMLSGGLDSATVVAAARELGRREESAPLAIFSAQSVAGGDCLETHFSDAVIEQGDLKPTRVLALELMDHEEAMVSAYEKMEAPFDCDMTMVISLYQRAHGAGHRILLDGIEGDLLASLGSAYPAHLLRAGRLWSGQRELLGLWKNSYRKKYPLWKLQARTLWSILPAMLRQPLKRWMAPRRLESLLVKTIIRPDFARGVDLAGRLERLRGHGGRGLAPSLRAGRCRQLGHPYLAVGLERYDRLAALCGIEARHPLLERRLVDFCLALPWEQKTRGGWSKLIMRRAGEGRLPHALCWRRGHEHLGGDFTARWMSLRADAVDAELQAPDPALERYVDLAAARMAWHNHRRGGSCDDQVNAWYAYMLSRWLRRQ